MREFPVYTDNQFSVDAQISDPKSRNWVITFNYFYPEFEPIRVANPDKDYAWGRGVYANCGLNQINVVSRCCNYFQGISLDQVVENIRAITGENANILCIGTSMGGYGAILFAEKLKGNFFAFSPRWDKLPAYANKKFEQAIASDPKNSEELRNLKKRIVEYFPAIEVKKDYSKSLIFYDPYAVDEGMLIDREAAEQLSRKFSVRTVPIPCALHHCVAYLNKAVSLKRLVLDYFKDVPLTYLKCFSEQSNQKQKKVAVVCSSNALLKNGFFAHFKEFSNHQFDLYAIGDCVSASAILTIIKNDIKNKYDFCIFDQFLNDLIFLERSEISEDYLLGAWHSLLALFDGRCQPIAILHSPQHIDVRNHNIAKLFLNKYSVPIIDFSDLIRAFESSIGYSDLSHYSDDFQRKIAKFISTKIDLFDYEFAKFRGIQDISATCTNVADFLSVTKIPRNTSKVSSRVIRLTKSDDIRIIFDKPQYLVGVEFWSDTNSNYFTMRVDDSINIRKDFKKKFINKIAFEALPEIYVKEQVSISLSEVQPDKYLTCHNGVKTTASNAETVLDFVDLLCSDIPFTVIGNLVRKQIATDIGDDHFSILPQDEQSLYHIRKNLRKLINPFAKVQYLYESILINRGNESKLLEMVGDVYREDEDWKRAYTAYRAALSKEDNACKTAVAKASSILIFNLKDYKEARAFLEETSLQFPQQLNEAWYIRHMFLIHRFYKEEVEAIFYAKRCLQSPENVFERWWVDAVSYLLVKNRKQECVLLLDNCPAQFKEKIKDLITSINKK